MLLIGIKIIKTSHKNFHIFVPLDKNLLKWTMNNIMHHWQAAKNVQSKILHQSWYQSPWQIQANCFSQKTVLHHSRWSPLLWTGAPAVLHSQAVRQRLSSNYHNHQESQFTPLLHLPRAFTSWVPHYIVSCCSKSQNGLIFWYPLIQVVLESARYNECCYYVLRARPVVSLVIKQWLFNFFILWSHSLFGSSLEPQRCK